MKRIMGMALIAFVSEAAGQAVPIRYLLPSVSADTGVNTVLFEEDFADSTYSNILYQHLDRDSIPVFYERKIKTSVCFDGKCRLLDMSVYWKPTGGYLGFEMPQGEFLSKTDHEPFRAEDYEKLHAILADSLSPLADYSFFELVPGTGNPDQVDAVSSATLKDIVDFIVPGAAFTTYRLWHLVHGRTRQLVSAHSERLLNEKFALLLLAKGSPGDQIWGLERAGNLQAWGELFLLRVMRLGESENLNLAAAAIRSFPDRLLETGEVQHFLVQRIKKGGYPQKKMALAELFKPEKLCDSTVAGLVELIPEMNGDLLADALALLFEKKVDNLPVIRKLAVLLDGNNRYNSGKVYSFLEKVNSSDAEIRKKMAEYKLRRAKQ